MIVKFRLSHVYQSALAVGLAFSIPAHSALHDRGGGLIYDDVLNVTWLQDAAYTFGPPGTGFLVWQDALSWADNLTYFDPVRNQTLSDWRLPRVRPVNGLAFNTAFSYDGSTDYSLNIHSMNSELAYMYYVNLGNIGAYDTAGNPFPPGHSQFPNVTFTDAETGLPVSFLNLMENTNRFWSGTPYPPGSQDSEAWMFDTRFGWQFTFPVTSADRVWAVRDGDVAAVPEPEAYTLLISGLVLISWLTGSRRNKRSLRGHS